MSQFCRSSSLQQSTRRWSQRNRGCKNGQRKEVIPIGWFWTFSVRQDILMNSSLHTYTNTSKNNANTSPYPVKSNMHSFFTPWNKRLIRASIVFSIFLALTVPRSHHVWRHRGPAYRTAPSARGWTWASARRREERSDRPRCAPGLPSRPRTLDCTPVRWM